jgi:hypothetical protein
MKYIRRTFRLMRINYILIRYNLDEFIFTHSRFSPFSFLGYLTDQIST